MVKVGQIWMDKDKRMSGRRVMVQLLDEKNGWVKYSPCSNNGGFVSTLRYRSMLKRFTKAFELVA